MMEDSKYQSMAQLCMEKYQSLGKTGKPLDTQWTTLCCLLYEQSDSFEVACLTTGTKCVTGSPSKSSNVLIDCHAEVLCKRAFKHHLMGLIEKHSDYSNHLENLTWHLFISQLPCGTIDRYQGPVKKDANHGIHRKPGRGEPCNEASCIDKILKWSYLGIQGRRLISLTRRPIRLKSIIIGNCVETKEFDLKRINQALTIEMSDQQKCQIESFSSLNRNYQQPEVHFVETIRCSPFIRYNNLQSCPSAIVWWSEKEDKREIVVEGLKQGVNKKLAECNPLKISRQCLGKRFNQLIEKSFDQDNQASEIYEKTWRHLKTLPRFNGWKNTEPID